MTVSDFSQIRFTVEHNRDLHIVWQYPDSSCRGAVIAISDRDFVTPHDVTQNLQPSHIRRILRQRVADREEDSWTIRLSQKRCFVTVFASYDDNSRKVSSGTSADCRWYGDFTTHARLHYAFQFKNDLLYLYMLAEPTEHSPIGYTLPALSLEINISGGEPLARGMGEIMFGIEKRPVANLPFRFGPFDFPLPSVPAYGRLFVDRSEDDRNLEIVHPSSGRIERSRFRNSREPFAEFTAASARPTVPTSSFEQAFLEIAGRSRNNIIEQVKKIRPWRLDDLLQGLNSSYPDIVRASIDLLSQDPQSRMNGAFTGKLKQQIQMWLNEGQSGSQSVSTLLDANFWDEKILSDDLADLLMDMLKMQGWLGDVYERGFHILAQKSPPRVLTLKLETLLRDRQHSHIHTQTIKTLMQFTSPESDQKIFDLLATLVTDPTYRIDTRRLALQYLAQRGMHTAPDGSGFNLLLAGWLKIFVKTSDPLSEAVLHMLVSRLEAMDRSDTGAELLQICLQLGLEQDISSTDWFHLLRAAHITFARIGRNLYDVDESNNLRSPDLFDALLFHVGLQLVNVAVRRADPQTLSDADLFMLFQLASISGNPEALTILIRYLQQSGIDSAVHFITAAQVAITVCGDTEEILEWLAMGVSRHGSEPVVIREMLKAFAATPIRNRGLSIVQRVLHEQIVKAKDETVLKWCIHIVREQALWDVVPTLHSLSETSVVDDLLMLWKEMPHPDLGIPLIEWAAGIPERETLLRQIIPDGADYQMLHDLLEVWVKAAHADGDLRQVESQIDTLHDYIEQVGGRQQIDRLHQGGQQVAADIDALDARVKGLRQDAESARNLMNSARQQAAQRTREADEAQSDIQKLVQATAEVEQEIAALRRSANSDQTTTRQIANLEVELQELMTDRQSAERDIRSLNDQVALAQDQAKNAELTLNRINVDLSHLDQHRRHLTAQLTEMESQLEDSQRANMDLVSMQERLELIRAQRFSLKTRKDAISRQWDATVNGGKVGIKYRRSAETRVSMRRQAIEGIRQQLHHMIIN